MGRSMDAAVELDDIDIMSILNSTSIYEETISSEFVIRCSKKAVNYFGSRLIPAFYHSIFLLSLLGNGLVLYTIYRFEKLNSVTNIFLVNLVVSDLVFSFSLPFWATYHSSEWIFGRALCKLVGGVHLLGFCSSALFLTLMTFDRYLAVVHAISAAKRRRRTYALVCSVVVWCVSIAATFNEFILFDLQPGGEDGVLCEEDNFSNSALAKWQVASDYQQFVLFFLFPLSVILYCYIRIILRILNTRMKKKFRTIKLIFVIVVTFFICWMPYNVVVLLHTIQAQGSKDPTCSDQLDYGLYITRNITYLYCCINPVFYTFLGKKFRNHFFNLVARCTSRQIVTNHSSRTSSQKSPESVYE